ncbi:hypothetical protein ACFL96_00845 [Thermoproteota archaeon]
MPEHDIHLFSNRIRPILDGIISRNTCANAYIFTGQKGSFTAQAALYFGQTLCGKQTSSNPDLIQIKPEGKLNIQIIRDIQEIIKYGPSAGTHMVVIIHNSSQFTTEAANAFLKTLEEPPEGVIFILISDNINDMLPTIKSRCQPLFFPLANTKNLIEKIKTSFPDTYKDILAACYNQPLLLAYYLEDNFTLQTPYIPITDLIKISRVNQLKHVQALAGDKLSALLTLTLWLQDLSIAGSAIKNIKDIIDNISQMKYNLNLRLHLESLMMKL